jgi:hypothetical protein
MSFTLNRNIQEIYVGDLRLLPRQCCRHQVQSQIAAEIFSNATPPEGHLHGLHSREKDDELECNLWG